MLTNSLVLALTFSFVSPMANATESSFLDIKPKVGDQMIVVQAKEVDGVKGVEIKECKFNRLKNQYSKCRPISDSGRTFYGQEEFDKMKEDFTNRYREMAITVSTVFGGMIGVLAVLTLASNPIGAVVILVAAGGGSGRVLYEIGRNESAKQGENVQKGVFEDRNDVTLNPKEYAEAREQLKWALDSLR